MATESNKKWGGARPGAGRPVDHVSRGIGPLLAAMLKPEEREALEAEARAHMESWFCGTGEPSLAIAAVFYAGWTDGQEARRRRMRG